jgi:hypothetical protein
MVSRSAALLALLAISSVGSAQRLFRATDPVEVTFTTNLRAIVRERDSTKLNPYGAEMLYKDSAGNEVKVPVTLRARGHFRRQARNCHFPPIRWDARREATQGTLFQGLQRMKITTNCRPGQDEYEQYVLGEYGAYRTYAALSPLHFRTRLARITYKDLAKATGDVTSWAFFIEDDAEMARQNRMRLVDTKGALFSDVDEPQLMRTTLFEYMIGNTDVSISGLHNIVLLRDTVSLNINTVAYDFDFSGIVNTRYSSVDPRLPNRKVTERHHRGPCKSVAEWKPIFAEFQAKKAAIDSIWGAIPGMNPNRTKNARDFLADFWRAIGDDRVAKREIAETCQKLGM